ADVLQSGMPFQRVRRSRRRLRAPGIRPARDPRGPQRRAQERRGHHHRPPRGGEDLPVPLLRRPRRPRPL
ncbi:MAG: hypothetical protein AVDCRST_MAG05-4287, partial [uncultured Rubrobacteraceae bacterium]